MPSSFRAWASWRNLDFGLKGKTAVVTGASKGLGRGIGIALALEGVKVLAVGRDEKDLDSLKNDPSFKGQGVELETFVQDLQDETAAEKIAQKTGEKFGELYLLVNGAGASQPVEWDAPDDEWKKGMLLNFERPRQLAQRLIPLMIEGGSGRIINITGAVEMNELNVAGVAKAALTSWTKGMSAALAQHDITVNCVMPGLIDTPQIRHMFPGERGTEFAKKNIPMGRFGEPIDLASLVVFLASGPAHYITGISAAVDGGMRQGIF